VPNIADTYRYSLENVLLFSFLFSSFTSLYPALPHRFHSLRRPLFFIQPLLSARIRKGRRKVLFSRRGVFYFHPRVLFLPLPIPPVHFFSFFRVQIELYERVSAKVRHEKVKAKWKSATLFLKIVREIHRAFGRNEFPLFPNRCLSQFSNLRLKCKIFEVYS